MNRGNLCRVAISLASILAGSAGVFAQRSTVPSRIAGSVDNTRTVVLKGNVHPMARAAYDRGALADSQPMTHMMLLLQRSAEQEFALKQLINAQQSKSSASFHSWVTPEEFGLKFGPSDADIQTVTDWLTRQGFQNAKLSKGRTVIEFNGTAGQVRNSFHTEIHKFVVNGEEHVANVTDPSIPAALSPVVAGIVALNNFPRHAQARKLGTFQRDKSTGQVRPLFTYAGKGGDIYAVGPADFATIYNVPNGIAGTPATTYDGTGQSIAIVGQSNINTQDVIDFRSMFNLPAYSNISTNGITGNCDLCVVVNGPDPGIAAGDELESDLDVQWAGAVAPKARIIFVTSQTTQASATQVIGGVDLSALYIVDNNVAPILSESYGLCEPFILTAGNAFYNALWQQAAAEGITVVIASGDSGSAGCDSSFTESAATNGLAVSGTASTPYSVSVGGTDFDQFSNAPNYWNPSTTPPPANGLSALGYIPEVPWNDSACAANFPSACKTVDTSFNSDLTAGGGGSSNCVLATVDSSGTTINCNTNSTFPNGGYPKPAFQTNITPADSARDIPDVSLFASDGYNGSFYVVCQSDANTDGGSCSLTTSPNLEFVGVGGTSAGTPGFAGIIALVNQSLVTAQNPSPRQGNANYTLYLLAKNQGYTSTGYPSGTCKSSNFTTPSSPAPASCVFYDLNVASNSNGVQWNNAVACQLGSPNCLAASGANFGVVVDSQSNAAFATGAGYDLATGLGSINVANLISKWSTANLTATTTALGTPSATSVTSGSNFTIPVSVTAGATGDVSLFALDSSGNILGSYGPFTLSGSSVSASTNLLPPSTVSIKAYYGGDVSHAGSLSSATAVSVSGANKASKTTLNFVTFDSNNNPVYNMGSQTVSYGSPYILQMLVTDTGGASCLHNGNSAGTTPGSPCPTGTIALTDNGSALNDWPIAGQLNATNKANLNSQGMAEDQPIQLSAGSHSIIAAFTTGDSNFQSSNSNTLNIKIDQAATAVEVFTSSSSVVSGSNVTLTAFVITQSNGAGPTGTMTFTNGSNSIGTANCVPTDAANNTNPPIQDIPQFSAFCTATLTTAISNLYPPPSAEPRSPNAPVLPIVTVVLSLLLFALGLRWIPQTRRRAYAYVSLLAIAMLVGVVVGCGGGSGGGGGGGGNRTITATYPGDTNYSGQKGTVSITVQ